MAHALVMDASVWVSALLAQDANHRASRRWLDGWLQAGNRLHVPVLILSEVAGAVARRTLDANRGHRAATRLGRVPRVRFVPLDAALGDDAAIFAADLGLRGADASYVALAHRLGLPLATWDQEVLTRAAAVIQTRTP